MEDIIEKYFHISGKINRKTFFYRSLILQVMLLFGIFTTMFIGVKYNISPSDIVGKIMGYSLFVVFFTSMLSLSIRRLRDTNQAVWWSGLILIPYINIVVFFIFIFLKSHQENPQY